MNAPSVQRLIDGIHESSTRIVLAIYGGASRVVDDLTGGRARSCPWLETRVTTNAKTLSRWIGASPEEPRSAATARALAMASFCRARERWGQEEADGNVAGVGCVEGIGAPQGGRRKRPIFVAAQTIDATLSGSLWLEGPYDSSVEPDVRYRFILNYIALACGIVEQLDLGLLQEDRLTEQRTEGRPEWRQLVCGGIKATCAGGPSSSEHAPRPAAVFPGAFHPLHAGHRRMHQIARQLLGCDVAWELSIANVDKPLLDYTAIAERTGQFSRHETLWLTCAPTFVEKAEIFPGATFIVGADTIARIGAPRYYGSDPAGCRKAIARIAEERCRFLVFGRAVEDQFWTLSNLQLPGELKSLCQEVGMDQFRLDVSSTQFRQQ